MPNLKTPQVMVFVASMLFGITAIFTKIIMGVLTPVAILTFRFVFLVVTFPLLLKILNKGSLSTLFLINKKEFKIFFFLSFLLVADMVLFFQSFYFIDVNKALFLFLTYPIISLVIANIFLKEGITLTDFIAAFISLVGILMIFWKKFDFNFYHFKGEFMVLAAALLWAGYIVMNRYSGDASNHYKKTFWIFLLNSIMLMPIFLLYGKPTEFVYLKLHHIFLLLALSIFSTLIPYTLLGYTAKHIKSSTTSIILLLGPIIGLVLSFIVLQEKPPFNVMAGGLLILVSAFISTYSVEKLFSASKHFTRKIRTILFGY